MNGVDWEDLRHFAALAEALNLARAAARLRTSQVTILRRVKALEVSLGTTLFLRRRDGHRLTPAGIDLLQAIQEASLLIEQGARRVSGRDAGANGGLRIATTELAANYILLPALAGFQAANPDIRLEIDTAPEALRLTDDAETIALRFRRPDKGLLRIRLLGEIGFSLYTRTQAEAAPTPGYIGWTGPFAEIGLARWLREAHGDQPPSLLLTTFEGHLRAVHAGIGASALPDFIAARDPRLSRIATAARAFTLEAWLVVPEQIAPLARVRKVMAFIEGAVARITV